MDVPERCMPSTISPVLLEGFAKGGRCADSDLCPYGAGGGGFCGVKAEELTLGGSSLGVEGVGAGEGVELEVGACVGDCMELGELVGGEWDVEFGMQ
jgi:hypothetical protein